ncbi:Dynein intermediate chain 2, axonemal [Gaertneriomyces sp. JEL0708]|nr:Dynein intermediate chain 2, axonemal [Gaertneriomyces sp. JEL0708]
MEIVYVYQRKRRDFGRQPTFTERLASLSVNIPPDPSAGRQWEEKKTGSVEIQCGGEKSEHEVNTESFVLSNKGILHTQGGWPKDVDPTDVEHTIRYRKKVEKDDEYMRAVQNLGSAMEHCIKQNNAIDIYEDYFTTPSEIPILTPTLKPLNIYRDPNTLKRSATHISFYPDSGHKIAVAYSSLQFQNSPSNMSFDSYIWDVENPNMPEQTLTPPSPLVCLKYNPKDPHIIVGGCYNGLVTYWDTRKGAFPVDTSAVEKGHRDPVYGVNWVQSKSGTECFSVSTDGQVLWWDIRKMSEPTESMTIDPEKNGSIVGGTVLDYETTMPTKFMVGGENGSVFMCNKKAKNPSERITHIYPGHHGPVLALQRNPFFLKNFLTIGDWRTLLWAEDIRSPIITTPYSPSYLTDASWSPTRPAVFLASTHSGTIQTWDLLTKQTGPTLTTQVSPAPIHCLKIQEHGRTVAVGDREGGVTILEMSEALWRPQKDEKAIFGGMLEREAKREKTLESSAREKRLKAQQVAGQNENGQGGVKEDEKEEIIKATEEEFWSMVGK